MKTLAKAGEIFESESSADLTVEVLVDTSASSNLVALCHKVLEVRPGTAELTILGFDAEMPVLNKDASLIIVVAGASPCLKRVMEIAHWSELHCVVLAEDAPALVAAVPEEDALEIARAIIEVDVDEPQEVLERNLARWCISRLRKQRLALGVAFPFMRQPIASDLTRQTAIENAVIASVFFLPGADLPVLTLNQCKLLYQIAVINEVPLSRARLADLAAVIGSAFGHRGLARLLSRKLSPIKWVVRGATAFGATMALGHLAFQLYSRGGGLVELAKGELDLGCCGGSEDSLCENGLAEIGFSASESGSFNGVTDVSENTL